MLKEIYKSGVECVAHHTIMESLGWKTALGVKLFNCLLKVVLISNQNQVTYALSTSPFYLHTAGRYLLSRSESLQGQRSCNLS